MQLFAGISHELHWSVGFGSIVSCEDDSFQNQKYPCVARFFTFINTKDERLTSLATTHNSAIWVCTCMWNLILSDVCRTHLIFCKLYFKAISFGRIGEDILHKRLDTAYKYQKDVYRVNFNKSEQDG